MKNLNLLVGKREVPLAGTVSEEESAQHPAGSLLYLPPDGKSVNRHFDG